MTHALILTLPGLLCAVLAWDLCRPARGSALLPTRSSVAVAALLAGCGATVLVSAWLPGAAPTSLLAGTGAAVLAAAGRRRPAGLPPHRAAVDSQRAPVPSGQA